MIKLSDIQAGVPVRSKAAWALQSAGVGGLFLPTYGLVPSALAYLHSANLLSSGLQLAIPAGIGGSLAAFYAAKGLQLFAPKKRRGIWYGEMFIPEDAFWTSILITGRPGSGKTSGAIMPPFEQIVQLYVGPDYVDGKDESGRICKVENPHARIGGTVLEVKGEFYEPVGYQLHLCGRNVYTEFFVIRPDSRIPVAKLQDPETKFIYYVNGLPCSSGSEAGRLLMQAQSGLPADAQRIREDILSCLDKEYTDALPRLRDLTFEVADEEVMYIGWREEGGELVRVTHTPEYNQPAYALDAKGEKIRIKKPKRLKFLERVLVSNGLRYNLIDPTVPANEAAEKLTRMAAMSGRGEGKGGDNSYWYNNAQKLISSCIALQRTIEPDNAVTCKHIYRAAADERHLQGQLKVLQHRLTALQAELNLEKDPDRRIEIETRLIEPLRALQVYFTGEWVGLDEKTKGIIKTVVSNVFSNFVNDPGLGETFCSPATFSFADCLQKGHFFCFVPGPNYENLAKVIGTGLKTDMQFVWLQRLQRADYNRARPLLHLTDECWNWVIKGADPKFLSLCRQARVLNLLATQNYDQFVGEIGREETNNFLGEFGVFVWLQNFNEFTNRTAENMMTTVKREKFTGKSGGVGAFLEGKGTAAKMEATWEEKKLYEYQDFVKLSGTEAIVFNGYEKGEMAKKTDLPKSRLTHPAEKPKIARFMREYMRGSLEQALWKQDRVSRLDHLPGTAAPTATSDPASATPVPVSATSAVAAPSSPPELTPTRVPDPPVASTPPAKGSSKPPHKRVFPPTSGPSVPGAPVTAPAAPATPAPSAPAQPAAVSPSPYRRRLHFPRVVPEGKQQAQSPSPVTSGAAPPEAKSQPLQSPPGLNFAATADGANDGAASVGPVSGSRLDAASIAAEPDGEAGGAAGLSPSDIDRESDEFKRTWSQLSNVTGAIVADDLLGAQQWATKMLGDAQTGKNTGPDLLVGPAGISTGDPQLRAKAVPFADPPLDAVARQERMPPLVARREADAEAYMKRTGPKNESWA